MSPANPRPPAPTALDRLNALPASDAASELRKCCGSIRWAQAMAARRPFPDVPAMLRQAGTIWHGLDRTDWLEAFSHHPRIGERDLTQPKFAATAHQAGREQSGMAAATSEQRRQFVELNAEYERKFGHVFLICASGKTADFMLAQLRERLLNDAATELHNAAREQNMITRLRLERMLGT